MDNITKAIAEAIENAEAEVRPIKKMYRVEKFLPPACPKCKHPFAQEVRYKEKLDSEGRLVVSDKEEGDYALLLGDMVDGKKVIRETTGYNIIICAHCRNYTARYPLETYQVSSKEKAEELIAKQGFQNLSVFTAMGNMTQDQHAIIAKSPGIRVRDAMKDYPDDQDEDDEQRQKK